MKLTNPNQHVAYDRIDQDRDGTDLFGYREVDGQQEIVNIKTGKSNMNYYTPEMVMNPEGCEHAFTVTSIGKREVECRKCRLTTSFHPAVNYVEEDGKAFIVLNHKKFQLFL